jgi:hypothetical protein
MKAFYPKNTLLALVSSVLVISCSSGGSGTMTAGGGIDGSGIISRGSLSAFGSVFVNGTEFGTSNAAMIINGHKIGIGDDVAKEYLDIGRVITVEGKRFGDPNTAVADRVTYKNNVKGPVESIDELETATMKIVVVGQTVIVNAATNFKNTSFDTIAQNDVVEVSGLLDDTGVIWATFVGRIGGLTPGLGVEVTGYTVNIDTTMKSFEINGLIVDYSLADTSGLPSGLPDEGLFVEVEGTLDATGDLMVASKIQLGDGLGADDVDEIELTSFVTEFISLSEFKVGNQLVQADAETLYIDGAPENVDRGVKLEVGGTLVNGVLIAKEIEFWGSNQIEVEGVITSIVSQSEFSVGNQVVQTNFNTVFEDGVPGDIALGVKVEIKGVYLDTMRSNLSADKVSFEVQ